VAHGDKAVPGAVVGEERDEAAHEAPIVSAW
jgi:hypothetical protein